MFRNCGQESDDAYHGQNGCIQVYDRYGSVGYRRNKRVKLECLRNVFENNLCYPISERYRSYVTEMKCRLEGNELRGFNGNILMNRKVQIDDADRLYVNDEPSKPFGL